MDEAQPGLALGAVVKGKHKVVYVLLGRRVWRGQFQVKRISCQPRVRLRISVPRHRQRRGARPYGIVYRKRHHVVRGRMPERTRLRTQEHERRLARQLRARRGHRYHGRPHQRCHLSSNHHLFSFVVFKDVNRLSTALRPAFRPRDWIAAGHYLRQEGEAYDCEQPHRGNDQARQRPFHLAHEHMCQQLTGDVHPKLYRPRRHGQDTGDLRYRLLHEIVQNYHFTQFIRQSAYGTAHNLGV